MSNVVNIKPNKLDALMNVLAEQGEMECISVVCTTTEGTTKALFVPSDMRAAAEDILKDMLLHREVYNVAISEILNAEEEIYE